MILGRWFITPHAIERYRMRHRPDISNAAALTELCLWSDVAVLTGPTRTGDQEWRSPDWFPRRLRFIVSPTARSEGDRPQLVTVLPGKCPGWISVEYELEKIMSDLVVAPYPWGGGVIDREWLASRRARYALARRSQDAEYQTILSRARASSRSRLEQPGVRDEMNRRLREQHRIDRAERVEGRVCRECGAPVTPRKGIGPTPIYCSQRCNHRVASRNWWRRQRASVNTTNGER